ncbi:uncharacterized protein LOC132169457 [Corylus avellana]|uniref:uncharacterized protein LOC132169457 n=1 Tax=Corylus avellana TaxID=13451 RepID=UPI00286C869E|nr:uncharacterized protein LOC132169457 [Corylus avellana]
MKKLYDKWNIQGFLLLSLSLQTILILLAPFRKRTGRGLVISLIWLAYLVADWVANFAVGLISNSQKYSGIPNNDHADILAFWVPFLLLHLGGPDTITAFSLEDNALWRRHLVGLLSQLAATITVFSQSFPKNKLWVPTVLVFVAGTIKYVERTRALFRANLDEFRESMLKAPDPGPNYAKLMDEYSSNKEVELPTRIQLIPEPNKESQTGRYPRDLYAFEEVEYAYHFFEIFKGLIVDLIFSYRERHESQMFFFHETPEDAFKVLAIELNFIYEVLYTKVVVVHSMTGYLVRFISWCAVVAALSTFYPLDKHGFRNIDVGITYTLLFGAIGLDTIALFMMTFSDWTAVSFRNYLSRHFIIAICFCGPLSYLFGYILHLKKINWGEDIESMNRLGRARRILFRRWCESLHTFNLIDYCVQERPKRMPTCFDDFCYKLIWVIKTLGPKGFYDQMNYVSTKPLKRKLWVFIFDELKMKSNLSDDPNTTKKIYSARGEWVLQNIDETIETSKLRHYIADVDYDQSLILWHIATELCYQEDSSNTDDHREFSKILSDYMLHLQVMQPTMMSAVAGIGQIRFRDTCAEAKRFFNERGIDQHDYKGACTRILKVNTDVEPVAVKGDRSKSVLFDACILAKELQKLVQHKKWELMSTMWVELLSYAASHCRANAHAAQLSNGGELITFVWLLMAHFGLGDQFQINKGPARAKLIVGK